MSTDIELTEAGVKYLDSLEPAERDEYYKALRARKNMKPAESLDSLTKRLAELGKGLDYAERKKVSVEIDRRLTLNAEHQLSLFINDAIERGVVNVGAVKTKARDLGLPHFDVTKQINSVVDIREMHARLQEVANVPKVED